MSSPLAAVTGQMAQRDNFTESTKAALAKRVGYLAIDELRDEYGYVILSPDIPISRQAARGRLKSRRRKKALANLKARIIYWELGVKIEEASHA